jgi:hypothetical protein
MPRQNRATPFGSVVAVPERGTVMGNRGVLHDAGGTVRRAWQLRRWILCLLVFNGRRREVMSPGRYTELFFLDEATGLAAGHRPCAECQRRRFNEFRAAWLAGDAGREGTHTPAANEIDERLHRERLGAGGEKVRFEGGLDQLPDGVFVTLEGDDETAHLVWRGELLEWSPGGYRKRRPRPRQARVLVLTPASTVAAIRAGFAPNVHATVGPVGRE